MVTRADLGPKQAPGPIDIPIAKNCPVLKNPKPILNSFLSPRSAFTPVPPSAKQFLNQMQTIMVKASTPAGESAPNFSGAKNSFTVNNKDSEVNLAELVVKSSVAESHVQDTQEATRQADPKGWQPSSTLALALQRST